MTLRKVGFISKCLHIIWFHAKMRKMLMIIEKPKINEVKVKEKTHSYEITTLFFQGFVCLHGFIELWVVGFLVLPRLIIGFEKWC